ncbi:hypothetical protein BZG36_03738 [Bifiguratus adelaidae]|uniref:Indoleamine 2,3-dioxygenase n=1 Tax=Bifiguratus adelaidae TaxID=1938954 RepID=A0A261XY38_9FUNG|nr:hypothetical protein BZG36_03738 [Bifiguratus adelaidae]
MAFRLTRLLSTLLSRSFSSGAFKPSSAVWNARALEAFPVLTAQSPQDDRMPSFMVGETNGFLPRQAPLVELPNRFHKLEYLLQRMPLVMANGEEGLLAKGKFGDAVKALPEYEVDDITDAQLLSALYRDYTFVASAYLLEPCDIMYREKKDYGLGRQVLPRNVAVPLAKVAAKIGAKPFMEYALSYSLYNYKRIDPTKGLTYDNLALIRAFAGSESEKGFILNHVTMVAFSGDLIKHTQSILSSCGRKDRQEFTQALCDLNTTYSRINEEMECMWQRSQPADYQKFRTFIMGTKNQPMFPHGVIYEGVSDTPMFLRGESGANDSMVPLGDNVLQLTARMPENPLTKVLRDFRTYRPTNHREYLEYVQYKADELGVRDFAMSDSESAAWYLANVDQIRAFRHRHWNFTKEYIIKYSLHPVATGGSPIVSWLPNQLGTVLNTLVETSQQIDRSALNPELKALVAEIDERVQAQQRVLTREVAKLKEQYGSSQELNESQM